jgi:hypothetical protein
VLGVRTDRRERTSSAQDRLSEPEGSDRRSPATYVTRRDITWLVVLLTLVDSLAKLAVVIIVGA